MRDPILSAAAKEALARVSLHYEQLPYEELERLANLPVDELPIHQERIGDHLVELAPMIGGLGMWHPRMCVEIFAYVDGSDVCRGLTYFERYASGRIERFDRFTWKDALLLLFLGGGAVATIISIVRWAWSLW